MNMRCAAIKRIGQPVNIVLRIVHGEGSAAGGGQAIAGQQRLGAMGAGAHRDAMPVDHRCDIMGDGRPSC